MNSLQIQKILETNPQTSKNSLVVFARDELPIINKYQCFFVLNTEKRSHPGKHWLAFYFDSEKTRNFFYSFGNSPKFFGLYDCIKNYSSELIYNNKAIQSWTSDNCGYYCILFLFLRSYRYTMETFRNLFYDDSEKNDKMINKLKSIYSINE